MAYGLRCPECRKTFKWEPSKEDPRYCPLCEADLGEPPADNVIAIPAFLSAKTKAGDDLYRQAEAASEYRVQKAAELAGCDPSEMAALKITDMRSTKNPGDIAAAPIVNEVTKQMEAINARGGNFGFGANGAEFAAGTATGAVTVNGKTTHGIEPRAGAKTLGVIQRSLGM